MADFMRCALGLLPYALEGTRGMERLFVGLQTSFTRSALCGQKAMEMIEAMAKDTKPPAREDEAYRRTFLDLWVWKGVDAGLITEKDVSFTKAWLSSNARVLQNALDFAENVAHYAVLAAPDETTSGGENTSSADTRLLSQEEEIILSGFLAGSTPGDMWPSQRQDSEEAMRPPPRPHQGTKSSAAGKRPMLADITNLSKIKNKKPT